MNILILSASTGGGHMSASNAIKNYIEKNNKQAHVKIVDSLMYVSPTLNKTVTNGYVYLATKTPKIYGKLYDVTNKETKISNLVSKLNSVFAERLNELFTDFKPDIILSTHPFPTEMISILKSKKKINIPLVCVMTDYASHKTWINENVDAYVVSNDDMAKEMINDGISSEIVYPFGIPIDDSFFGDNDIEDTLESLGLKKDVPTIMMMAGSFGVGTVLDVYKNIININLEFQIILITGKNQKLYEELEELTQKSQKKTKLIYFTKEINKLMQASDVLITKPGGLTVTESLACNIPMAIFDAIPGQEEENAEFLLKHNMAVRINDANYKEVIVELLDGTTRLNAMKEACKSFDKKDSNKNIYLLVNKLVSNQNKENKINI